MSTSRPTDPGAPARAGAEPVTSATLDGLRTRLSTARAQRGNCPPLTDIRQDRLPTITAREGRDERSEHVIRCPVCQHQLRSWQQSWEGRAALALAWSDVARYHVGVAAKAVLSKLPKRAPGPVPTRAEIESGLLPDTRDAEVWSPPVPERTTTRRGSSGHAAPPTTLPPLLVFEAPPPGVVPRALLAAVGDRGGAIVTVESLDEVFGDPDFPSVRALVLARARALAEWPEVIRRTRERAPNRCVLAVVPAPPFGPASLAWLRDPGVMLAPVKDLDWEPALKRAGWLGRP